MTLPASAIINGLTMLRAYKADAQVEGKIDPAGFRAVLCVGGVHFMKLHAADFDRMLSEGWLYKEDTEEWIVCV